ncbi:DUF1758 domain-containing protein [Trichonephila inaurata madagascariensis]|uniref:DUF1758 domain-containing protein n=1 Tax=Trichonephila inaurata madagascariensis TaxID=2747483 RepID=A0A8X7C8F5_9ARAC|nr:DUF1758 domain-containing protein [Trichonephila inaurata madagascariensis]
MVPDKVDGKCTSSEINMSSITYGPNVFLQTMKIKLVSDVKEVLVRANLDSGFQETHILKSLAKEMEYIYIPIRKETLIHSLFGGLNSDKCEHIYML